MSRLLLGLFSFVILSSGIARADSINLLISVKNEMHYPFPGAVVEVNRKRIGVVDNDGKISYPVEKGNHEIVAYIPGFQVGREKIHIGEWKTMAEVDIILREPDVKIQANIIKNSRIFPLAFNDIYLSLENRRKHWLAIDSVESMHLVIPGSEPVSIKEYFSIEKGRLYAGPGAAKSFRLLVEKAKDFFQIHLTVKVNGFEKRRLELEQEFLLGKHMVKGRLDPPRANAHLRIRALPWNYSLAGPVEFYITTKQDGSFTIPAMAEGRVEIENESAEKGENHWALWVDSVPRPMGSAELVLRERR